MSIGINRYFSCFTIHNQSECLLVSTNRFMSRYTYTCNHRTCVSILCAWECIYYITELKAKSIGMSLGTYWSFVCVRVCVCTCVCACVRSWTHIAFYWNFKLNESECLSVSTYPEWSNVYLYSPIQLVYHYSFWMSISMHRFRSIGGDEHR